MEKGMICLDKKSKFGKRATLKNAILSVLFTLTTIIATSIFAYGCPKPIFIVGLVLISIIMIGSMFEHAMFNGFLNMKTRKDKILSIISIVLTLFFTKYIFICNEYKLVEIGDGLSKILFGGRITNYISFDAYRNIIYVTSYISMLFLSLVMNYNMLLKYGDSVASFFKKLDKKSKNIIIVSLLTITIVISLGYVLSCMFNLDININRLFVESENKNARLNDIYLDLNTESKEIGPLFTAFTLPFSVIARELANLLYMVPNIFSICINLVCTLLYIICIICITRMFRMSSKASKTLAICASIIYATSLCLFSIDIFIFMLFYIFMFVYNYTKIDEKEFFYMSVSLMCVSIYLIPVSFFLCIKKGFKKNLLIGLQNISKILFAALMVGRLYYIIYSVL